MTIKPTDVKTFPTLATDIQCAAVCTGLGTMASNQRFLPGSHLDCLGLLQIHGLCHAWESGGAFINPRLGNALDFRKQMRLCYACRGDVLVQCQHFVLHNLHPHHVYDAHQGSLVCIHVSSTICTHLTCTTHTKGHLPTFNTPKATSPKMHRWLHRKHSDQWCTRRRKTHDCVNKEFAQGP